MPCVYRFTYSLYFILKEGRLLGYAISVPITLIRNRCILCQPQSDKYPKKCTNSDLEPCQIFMVKLFYVNSSWLKYGTILNTHLKFTKNQLQMEHL